MDAQMLGLVKSLTDVADQAVILPVIGMVAMVLVLQQRWRGAAAWVLILGAMLGTMLVLKVVLYACGWQVRAFDADHLNLRSPSGHSASAAAVAGGLAACLGRGGIAVPLGVAGAAALVVGITRLVLGVHSEMEVVVGATVGMAAAWCLAGVQRLADNPAPRQVWPVAVVALLMLLAFHGRHLPAEMVIQGRGALLLQKVLGMCSPPVASGSAPSCSQDAHGRR